jgi:hypothetical protein
MNALPASVAVSSDRAAELPARGAAANDYIHIPEGQPAPKRAGHPVTLPPRRGMARASLGRVRDAGALAPPCLADPSTDPLRQLLGLSGPRDTEPNVEHMVAHIVDELIDTALENARLTCELQRARREVEQRSDEARRVPPPCDAVQPCVPPRPPAPPPCDVAPSRTAPGADPVDLRLRPAVSALEQAYIRSAMARSGGNQTVAARLLGLSRFGLQKKLRRLASGGDPDDDDPATSPR